MKIRIISAIVAILIALPFVYFGGSAYAFAIGILAIFSYIEMLKLKKSHNEYPFIPLAIALVLMMFLIYSNGLTFSLNYSKLIIMVLALLIPCVFYKNDKYTTKDAFYLIGITLFLGVAFNSFIEVRDKGFNMFLFLVLIPIMTDTFALVCGKKFGKHKLIPEVSPHKTWEGSIGGSIIGTIIPCIFYAIAIGNFNIKILLGTFILTIIGQVGDLIFSKIKRENGIKDFSNIMPGHGGILDRLDSTIAIFMTYILLSLVLF